MKKIMTIAALSALVLAGGCGDENTAQTAIDTVGAAETEALATLPPLESEADKTEALTEDVTELSKGNMSFEQVLDKTFFIGDSVTSGFGGYQKVKATNVIATPNVSPSNVRDYSFEYDDKEYAALTILNFEQPINVVVSMGLNDINTYSPERFSELYMEYVEDAMKVCKDADFYIFSVTPVSAECDTISNETIDSTNAVLKETVGNHSSDRIHYVDVNTVLKGENGYMNEDYSAGDGIHLCSSAYDLLLDKLEESMNAE